MLPRFPLVSVMSLTSDVSAGTAACSWKINEELNLEQEGSRVPFPGCTSASKYSAARLNLGERSNPHFQAPLAQLCVGPSLVLCACSRAQLRVSGGLQGLPKPQPGLFPELGPAPATVCSDAFLLSFAKTQTSLVLFKVKMGQKPYFILFFIFFS